MWSLYNKRLRTKPLVLIITDRSLLGWSDNDMGSNEHNYLSSDGQSFIDNDVTTTGPHLFGSGSVGFTIDEMQMQLEEFGIIQYPATASENSEKVQLQLHPGVLLRESMPFGSPSHADGGSELQTLMANGARGISTSKCSWARGPDAIKKTPVRPRRRNKFSFLDDPVEEPDSEKAKESESSENLRVTEAAESIDQAITKALGFGIDDAVEQLSDQLKAGDSGDSTDSSIDSPTEEEKAQEMKDTILALETYLCNETQSCNELMEKNDKLKSESDKLKSDHTTLVKEYRKLKSDYMTLKNAFLSLRSEKIELEKALDAMEEPHGQDGEDATSDSTGVTGKASTKARNARRRKRKRALADVEDGVEGTSAAVGSSLAQNSGKKSRFSYESPLTPPHTNLLPLLHYQQNLLHVAH